MEFECYAQKSKCILGFPIKSGTQHFLCFHSMAACGDCGLRLLLCETNYMAISYRSLYSSFFSIAYFFFRFCFVHGTTSAEQKIKTVFHLLFLLLRYLDLHKIFLHDCVRKSTIQPPRSQRLPALRTVMC